MGKLIDISYANANTVKLPLEEVEQWEPKKITRLTGMVAFEVDGKFVSMKSEDYKKIFGNNLY